MISQTDLASKPRIERPTRRQLESLVAVAEAGSFRRAAAALGISQPALSALVRIAEQVLGVQVFERDRRGVLLTPAGHDVVGRAGEALRAIDAVGDAARSHGEPLVGPLRLGVIPTIAPYWLPPLLPRMRLRFPKLELILLEDQTPRLVAQLSAGQLELALLATPVSDALTSAEIVRERYVAVAAPASGDIDVIEAVRAASPSMLAQMVAGAPGVTLLPEAAVATLIGEHGPLAVAELDEPARGRTISLAWRMSSGRAREFRLLAEALAVEASAFLTRLRSARAKPPMPRASDGRL